MQRMSVFVDGANLFYCQRDTLHWWIDWKKFLEFLRKTHTVVSAHYYRAFRIPPTEEEKAFGAFLSTNGYHLREKMLKQVFDKYTGETTYKGNLDIELAIDALTSASRYDVCLLVSGDGDFVPLIRALTMLGKIVQVVSTPGSVALEIRSEVGLDFQDLQDIRSQIEKKERPPAPHSARTRAPAVPVAPPLPAPQAPTTVAPPAISVGQEFNATIANVSKGGANLANPWNANVFLPISGLGVRGYIEDASTLLTPGGSLHVVATDVDTSPDPWSVRVELADPTASQALQGKYDATKTPFDQIPDSGEYELTVGQVKQYGAFLKNPWGAKVLLHVSKLGLGYIRDCTNLLQRDESLRVRVTKKEMQGKEVMVSVELADVAYGERLQQRLGQPSPADEP